jgi:hypothetical protein
MNLQELKIGQTIIAERGDVSQKEVLQWRKDFDKLIAIVHATKPSSYEDAAAKYKKIESFFKTFEQKFERWLDFHVLQHSAKALQEEKGMQTKRMQPLLEDWENSTYGQLRQFDPALIFDQSFSELAGKDTFSLWRTRDPVRWREDQAQAIQLINSVPRALTMIQERFLSISFVGTQKKFGKLLDLIREYIGVHSFNSNDAKKGSKQIRHSGVIYQEFKVFDMTFINYAMLGSNTFKRLISVISPFMLRLQKLAPEVLYGIVKLLPTEGEKFTFKDGSGDSTQAGVYWSHTDTINIHCKDYHVFPNSLGNLMVHELGHRYYRRIMTAGARAKWEQFFKKDKASSRYGSTDPEEDFCETLAAYIQERIGMSLPSGYEYNFSRDIFRKLEDITGRRLTAAVVANATTEGK